MTNFRKIFASVVMVTMVFAMAPFQVAKAAATDGDLIKMSGSSSVYYLKGGKRFVFPNTSTYMSWYKDFSGVVTIPASELQSYPLGGNVVVRPGTKLVKITTDPTVYAVEPNGTLRSIVSEANAIALWGTDWAKKVIDVPDAFFTNYTIGTPLTTGVYPAGTLVKMAGSSDTYYFDGANYRKFASEAAFNANRFDFANVVTSSASFTAAGAEITAAEDNMTRTSQSGTSTGIIPGQGTGLTVALAADSAAAQSIPTNASVDFLKFNLTASNDGDVSVTGIKFSAAGLGTYSEIDEVTVYNNGNRLGNAKDIDSNKVAQISFTNALVVKKGTTETISVKAKVTGTSQYALSVNAAADLTVAAGVTVSGAFPVKGNTMSGVNVTVGKLTFDNDGSLSNVKLGDKTAVLGKFKATNDNVEDIVLKSITLKKDSSSTASDSDFENVALYLDGAQVSAATTITNRYITFTLNTPVTILKNNMKRFVVKGDVIGGAAKTVQFYLDATSDVTSTGSYYGYSATVTNNLTGAAVTIDAGAVTIEKVNATNTKIKKDTTDVQLGTFKITANSGKNVEISKFRLSIASANDAGVGVAFAQIENVELYNRTNNTVYDLTYSSGNSPKIYVNNSMGLILTSGVTNELVVRADVKSTATNGDYTPSIAAAYTNATTQDVTMKETGNDTLISDITPNSVSLAKVSVEAAAVTFSKNALSATYNAVVGTSDVELLNFNVKAGETSTVKLTELKAHDTTGNATNAVISEFKLWKAGASSPLKTVSSYQLSSNEITFSDLAETVAPNATNQYRITASLVKDSAQNGKTLNFRLSSYSVEETDKGAAVYDTVAETALANGVIAVGEAGYAALTSARTVTIKGTGSLNVVMDNTNDNSKYDTFVVAGASQNYLAAVKMKAVNEDVKVTKLNVTTSADFSANVSRLALVKTDGTEVAYSTTITSTGAVLEQDFTVPQSETTYYVKADFNKIGQNYPAAAGASTFRVDSIEAEGAQSGDLLVAGDNDSVVEATEIAYEADATANDYTASSKTVNLVASKMANVDLVSSASGQSLSTSITSLVTANAAIIKVSVPSTVNNNDDGSDLKFGLSRIKVNVQNNLTSYTTTIEKIGGSTGTTAGTVSGAYAAFTVTGADYQITPGTDAYYLVKIVPTFTGTYAGSHALKVNLDKLDGAAVTNDANGTNFSWTDRVTGGSAQIQLLIAGKTSVTGTEIKN